ncbi:hypothetical protein [Haloparvum sedimenti]|uniref:hypothetical protein n=1 Tax=Haloparvum sedimenti TaxID=1678448 RepID=UPI00071E71B4|nr:hypothetical protein [Haloparvum sedimenti]
MSDSHPTPPEDLPSDVVETLDDCSPEVLRQIATYAEDLAESREEEDRAGEESDEDTVDEEVDDLPEGVPSRATLTIKEINDNRYYYWQWREGDQVKSKYKGPVNPNE